MTRKQYNTLKKVFGRKSRDVEKFLRKLDRFEKRSAKSNLIVGSRI